MSERKIGQAPQGYDGSGGEIEGVIMKNENHCNRECKFLKDEEVCKKIRWDQNCYMCMVTNYDIDQEDKRRLQNENNKLRAENNELLKTIGYLQNELRKKKENWQR